VSNYCFVTVIVYVQFAKTPPSDAVMVKVSFPDAPVEVSLTVTEMVSEKPWLVPVQVSVKVPLLQLCVQSAPPSMAPAAPESDG
jgi:hypothetical protein